MTQLFHLLRADVRRFRLALGVWILVEITHTVFIGVRPTLAADPRLVTIVALLDAVLTLIRWLGLILIVPLVVHTHALVGSEAFWMTRPIAWHALFASKIVLLGTTFVAIPAMCELVLMLACRVPLPEAALVAIQTALFQALWLLIVMVLSAATRSLGRFALVVGAVLVACVLLINIVITVMLRSIPDGPQLTEVTSRSETSPTGGVVMLVLVIAAFVVQLVAQYRTRSARASSVAGLASVAVVVLTASVWPTSEQPLPLPPWATSPSALGLVVESAKGEFRPLYGSAPGTASAGWQIGGARLRISGIEAGWLPTMQLADGLLEFGDGTTLTTAGNGYSEPIPFELTGDFPNRVVLRHVLGVREVSQGSQDRYRLQPVPAIVLTQADFDKYSGASATYRGRFVVGVDQFTIASTLPLQPGAEYQDRQRRVVIEQILPQARAVSVRVRQFTTGTMFHVDTDRGPSFYLRNRDRSEAVAASVHEGIGMSAAVMLPLLFGANSHSSEPSGGFHVRAEFLRFPDSDLTDERPIVISADWVSQAELVVVHTRQGGSVMRTVEIPGFQIAAAPADPSR